MATVRAETFTPGPHPPLRWRRDTQRIEAFSDGVFAIAITLLILEVRLPADTGGSLANRLAEAWPGYVAFLISFLIIGIMWANHGAELSGRHPAAVWSVPLSLAIHGGLALLYILPGGGTQAGGVEREA